MSILSEDIKTKILTTYKDPFFKVWPNTKKNAEKTALLYTDEQWVEEVVKDFLHRQIERGLRDIEEDRVKFALPEITLEAKEVIK